MQWLGYVSLPQGSHYGDPVFFNECGATRRTYDTYDANAALNFEVRTKGSLWSAVDSRPGVASHQVQKNITK